LGFGTGGEQWLSEEKCALIKEKEFSVDEKGRLQKESNAGVSRRGSLSGGYGWGRWEKALERKETKNVNEEREPISANDHKTGQDVQLPF